MAESVYALIATATIADFHRGTLGQPHAEFGLAELNRSIGNRDAPFARESPEEARPDPSADAEFYFLPPRSRHDPSTLGDIPNDRSGFDETTDADPGSPQSGVARRKLRRGSHVPRNEIKNFRSFPGGKSERTPRFRT